MSSSGRREQSIQTILLAARFPSLSSILATGIGATILEVTFGIQNFIGAIAHFFSNPVRVGGDALGFLINGIIGSYTLIITRGAEVTANALLPGQSPVVIPILAFVYGIVIVIIAAYVMGLALSRAVTSDFLLGSGTDFPGVGADEDDQ